MTPTPASILRLRNHADYQRVYKQGRKQFSQQMSYFYALRPSPPVSPFAFQGAGPRVGLTVGKVLGKAVDRNRIKRRMREAVRKHISTLASPVDVVLHPRKTVLEIEFLKLEREVGRIFSTVQAAIDKSAANQSSANQSSTNPTPGPLTEKPRQDSTPSRKPAAGRQPVPTAGRQPVPTARVDPARASRNRNTL